MAVHKSVAIAIFRILKRQKTFFDQVQQTSGTPSSRYTRLLGLALTEITLQIGFGFFLVCEQIKDILLWIYLYFLSYQP